MPTPRTSSTIENSGLIARNTANGISVFFDGSKSETLQAFAADPAEPLRLVFEAISNDSQFSSYTDTPVNKPGSVLYFSNRGSSVGADGRYRLHSGEFVGADDFQELSSSSLPDDLSRSDGHFARIFVLDVTLDGQDINDSIAQMAGAEKIFFINFRGRHSIWKYYLLGGLAKEGLYVDDRDGQVEFVPAGEVTLVNEQVARSFTSKTPLPLLDRSEFHFQLKSRNSVGSKVLIKRLPIASPRQVSKEIVDGSQALVSEIFINR